MDSNHGPLVSEATALPTEPQPLPCADIVPQPERSLPIACTDLMFEAKD